MIIRGTLEEISSATISETEVECARYEDGLAQLKRTLPEGIRLIGILVER